MQALHLPCPVCRTLLELVNPQQDETTLCSGCGHCLRVRPRAIPDPPLTTEVVGPETGAYARLDTTLAEDPDVLGGSEVNQSPGPISQKGIRVQPHLSLTWGDFRVLRKLGGGSMGAVYLAQQKSLDRDVALKVLFKELTKDRRFVERFYREAKALQRLHHPGIVQCYGTGDEKGYPYFAMEYVDGFTTAVVLTELGGRFAVGDALHIVFRCAEALQHAHAQQVVHRDIKPENILINRLGYIKLADLGLAKPTERELSLTDTGVGLGTPFYMAPEQMRNAKAADARSDIYSLGVVLFQLLTGQLPFLGDGLIDVLHAKEKGHFPSPRRLNADIPPGLELLLQRMLAVDPVERPQTCGEVLRALGVLGMAHEHLHFNVLRVCHVLRPPSAEEMVPREEVLLLHDETPDILPIHEAIAEVGIPTNLTVVDNLPEAFALLKCGERGNALHPHLTILGVNWLKPANQPLLAALGQAHWLWNVPLVALDPAGHAEEVLAQHDLTPRVVLRGPADLPALQQLLKSIHALAVTIDTPMASPQE